MKDNPLETNGSEVFNSCIQVQSKNTISAISGWVLSHLRSQGPVLIVSEGVVDLVTGSRLALSVVTLSPEGEKIPIWEAGET